MLTKKNFMAVYQFERDVDKNLSLQFCLRSGWPDLQNSDLQLLVLLNKQPDQKVKGTMQLAF